MEKWFMHRIKEDGGSITAGIEVHDSRESAIRSFHAYMKQGYGNPDFPGITYVACWVEDPDGTIEDEYRADWHREGARNRIFLHHIRQDGASFAKAVDTCQDLEEAKRRFHAEMEYGYNNPKFPGVGFVSCMITELLSGVILKKDTWAKTEEPEPEAAAAE